mgnify:CR=1 FL=1
MSVRAGLSTIIMAMVPVKVRVQDTMLPKLLFRASDTVSISGLSGRLQGPADAGGIAADPQFCLHRGRLLPYPPIDQRLYPSGGRYGFDIVGIAAHQFPVGVGVEVAEGEPLHVVKEFLPDPGHGVLGHMDHNPGVAEGAGCPGGIDQAHDHQHFGKPREGLPSRRRI